MSLANYLEIDSSKIIKESTPKKETGTKKKKHRKPIE